MFREIPYGPEIKIMLEPNPLTSIMLVGILAVLIQVPSEFSAENSGTSSRKAAAPHEATSKNTRASFFEHENLRIRRPEVARNRDCWMNVQQARKHRNIYYV